MLFDYLNLRAKKAIALWDEKSDRFGVEDGITQTHLKILVKLLCQQDCSEIVR
jgi:hypothetical protein